MGNNKHFMAGKINFLLDGNAGSSGKGKISDHLVEKEDVDFLITSNSANASHTVVRDGKEFIFKVLPSGSIHHEKIKKVFIVDGASFELDALLKEIEMTGIPREKIVISPRAGIIQQMDKDYEAGICDLNGVPLKKSHDGTIKTGTTASGSGSVLAKKVLRNKTLVTAKNVEEISDMVSPDISTTILEMLSDGLTGFFEIGQGFPLSNNHQLFAPFTTSRNVTVSSALNDAFLPPHVCGNVIINFRTFPIKIHSNKYKASEDVVFDYTKAEALKASGKHTLFNKPVDGGKGVIINIKKGDFLSWFEKDHVQHEIIESPSGDFYPDQKEISWEELNKSLGNKNNEIFETTTLTKLPRRIAEFSLLNLRDAILHNDTGNNIIISVNFVNYLDKSLYKANSREQLIASERLQEWTTKYFSPVLDERTYIAIYGTGESNEDIVDLAHN